MKTITQAAQDYCNRRRALNRGVSEMQAFEAGANFATHWIPVGEELPEIKDENYQIILRHSEWIVTTYWVVKTSTKALQEDFFERHSVTHWRYIN